MKLFTLGRPGSIRLIPAFLGFLREDIRFLFEKDIPMPPAGARPGEAGRVIKFAAVRQAVRKQHIRESLPARLYRTWGIFSIITLPMMLFASVVWIATWCNDLFSHLPSLWYLLFP